MGACGAECGITKVREREQKAALSAAERVHPALIWREGASAAPAVSFDALVSLGQKLEELLPARAIVRAEDAGRLGAVHLLAGLHAPSLVEVAEEGRVARDVPLAERETYLRVAVSPLGRFATIQEVRAEARWGDGGAAVVLEPLLGVEDTRLRSMVKGLQGALRAARLTLLDMAFLARPLEGEQKAFHERFHDAPTLWSLLFTPAPATTVRALWIPFAR
jgi:hypothetical protein